MSADHRVVVVQGLAHPHEDDVRNVRAHTTRVDHLLEDLPGDGIGANLPAVVQKSLRESLKLEYQLEALLAGKMPDKGEKNKK